MPSSLAVDRRKNHQNRFRDGGEIDGQRPAVLSDFSGACLPVRCVFCELTKLMRNWCTVCHSVRKLVELKFFKRFGCV